MEGIDVKLTTDVWFHRNIIVAPLGRVVPHVLIVNGVLRGRVEMQSNRLKRMCWLMSALVSQFYPYQAVISSSFQGPVLSVAGVKTVQVSATTRSPTTTSSSPLSYNGKRRIRLRRCRGRNRRACSSKQTLRRSHCISTRARSLCEPC